MSETTFREAIKPETIVEPKIEAKNDMVIPETPTVEVPISAHYEITGRPYTADYFEVTGVWDKPDADLRTDLETIENAYKSKVITNEIKDSKEAFKAFIAEAEKLTNTKFSPPATKIAKIARWVRFMYDLKDIDRRAAWR